MELTIQTQIKEGLPLAEQTAVFQAWFNEHCMPDIDFADTCTVRDEWQRPLEWHLPEVKVVAEYFTMLEVPELAQNPNYMYNYNFKQWRVYGTI